MYVLTMCQYALHTALFSSLDTRKIADGQSSYSTTFIEEY